MTPDDTGIILVTLKNGHRFDHRHPLTPESDLLELWNKFYNVWTKQRKGILTLQNPPSMYRMEDISSIQFPETKEGTGETSMGFRPTKSKVVST